MRPAQTKDIGGFPALERRQSIISQATDAVVSIEGKTLRERHLGHRRESQPPCAMAWLSLFQKTSLNG